MSYYDLTPNQDNSYLIGTSAGPPNYTVIPNNGMDTRPLNQFDNKPFQSTVHNERDNQSGTAFIAGGKDRRTRRVRWNRRRMNRRNTKAKRSLAKRSLAKRSLTKKKKTHSHASYNQSYLSRKRKGTGKNILRRLFFGRGEPMTGGQPLGYTIDTKTNPLYGALANPFPMTGYE